MRSSRSRSAPRERLEPREMQWSSYIDLYLRRDNPTIVRHSRTSLFEVSRQSMISIHNLKDPSGPILFDGGFGAATGPLGDVLEPYGELSREQGKHAFREQYTMLKSEGIRVLLIETMMSLDEALLALETAKEVGFDAIGVTMTFEP